LGHGVRIAEDLQVIEREGDEVQVQFGDLARWVRDREIPLELSPSSNLQTGAIAQWGEEFADHPFDLLYQLGFSVTVNVDNRTMSATSLTRELSLLVDAFGYDLDDLEEFTGVVTTTEVVARHVAHRLAEGLDMTPYTALEVTLREHPDAWATYRLELPGS
ncbi:hypothetical protein ECC01_23430, partial [Bacillus tequilensis]|nr:hypothetical protein [Bacillus tequilensis]